MRIPRSLANRLHDNGAFLAGRWSSGTVSVAMAILAFVVVVPLYWLVPTAVHGMGLDDSRLKLAIECAALLVGITAFVVAIREVSHGRRVYHALTTRYVSVFPEFLPMIESVVRSAHRELIIVCDHPTYAAYSDPGAFREYVNAIEQTAMRISRSSNGRFIMVCLSAQRRRESIRLQLGLPLDAPDESRWHALRDEELRRSDSRLRAFLSAHRSESSQVEPNDISQTQFEAIFDRLNDMVIARVVDSGGEFSVVNDRIPLHMWIADSSAAFFTIPMFEPAEESDEHGFQSRDGRLVDALKVLAQNVKIASIRHS